jgi:hypothetical protein
MGCVSNEADAAKNYLLNVGWDSKLTGHNLMQLTNDRLRNVEQKRFATSDFNELVSSAR